MLCGDTPQTAEAIAMLPPVAQTAVLLLLLLLLPRPGSAQLSGNAAQSATMQLADSSVGYIIMLRNTEPVVSYRDGRAAGLAATAVAAGAKLHIGSAAVAAYAQHLEAQSLAVATRAGAADRVVYKYKYAFPGFAVSHLSAQELKALRSDPAVAFVSESSLQFRQTLTTPRFLQLAGGSSRRGRGGAWEAVGGPSAAGRNVVIGVIDSGIWPEHPSFYDRMGAKPTGPLAYTPVTPQLYAGECTPGQNFSTSSCNRKLVGCQYFAKSYEAAGGVLKYFPYEVLSCRDVDSHGTHTAATAGGNHGPRFLNGVVSGMAPKARIAAYKACWGLGAGSCGMSDILAAIDTAVADGVDVISYSLVGGPYQFPNPIGIAFMHAAAAGVIVAASAGNGGPEAGSVANVYPWVITVAASTHNREFRSTVQLGGGSGGSLKGKASLYNTTVGPAPLVLAVLAALPGAGNAAQCYAGSLDPAKVRGRIVVCDKGGNDRTEKGAEVKRAGGLGMLLVNDFVPSADYTLSEFQAVPTVNFGYRFREPLRSYVLSAAKPTATMLPTKQVNDVTAPIVARFSSRGPERLTKGAMIKPDVTAPGVDIIAAASPANREGTAVVNGATYAIFSGTSMSTPHVAGLAALLRQKHPTWSPMAIKSALMTTAYRTTASGKLNQPIGSGPFDFGSGHVNPPQMFNPGLLFDSQYQDWAAFVCAAKAPAGLRLPDDLASFCTACSTGSTSAGQGSTGQVCDPANLNLASVSLPAVVPGTLKIVSRTVTSVLDGPGSFRAVSSVNAAYMRVVSITPNPITLNPGDTQQVEIAIQLTEQALGAGFVTGSVTWFSELHDGTYLPISAKATDMDYPAEVSPTRQDASRGFTYQVVPGFTGLLNLEHQGLQQATVIKGVMLSNNSTSHNITIPDGTVYARFALFANDTIPAGNHDLGLMLYDWAGREVGSGSQNMPSDEQISYVNPYPDDYVIQVMGGKGDSQLGGPGQRITYFLHIWLLSSKGQTNMAVPDSVATAAGQPADVSLAFSGLMFDAKPVQRYLGSVQYSRGSERLGSTIICICQ